MRRAALVALLALAASACTIDVTVGISLDRNGSGSLTVDIVTDAEFEELYSITGREFEDLVATRGAEVGLAFTVTSDAGNHYSATANNLSADRFASILEGLAPGLGEVRITADETTLQFDAQLNPLPTIPDIRPWIAGTDIVQFEDDVNATVILTMEGEIETSTATRQDGDQLIWTIPFSDSPTRLLATSALEKDGPRIPWTLLLSAGTLIVAAVFLVSVRSNLAKTREKAQTVPTMHPRSASPPVEQPVSPPEDQAVAPDATPPEDQPVAPPLDSA